MQPQNESTPYPSREYQVPEPLGVTPVEPEPGDPAEQQPKASNVNGTVRAIREIAETLLLAVVLYVAVRAVVMPYEVDGASMEPNLHNHERVLVNRLSYTTFDLNEILDWIPFVDREGEWIFHPFGEPERGDVVVLNPPVDSDKPYIKRIIGLPGETVVIQDGHVYIDGVMLDEEYIDGPITNCTGRADNCEVTVPEGYVYVLGDNRGNSSDSRSFGVVAIDEIQGKAFFTNWPLDAIGPISHGEYNR